MTKTVQRFHALKSLSILDGFRGIAITLVVVYHAWTEISGSRATDNGFPFLSFVYAGSTGVTLFFILSGFLVTRPFIVSILYKQPLSLRSYVIARALRILPPYYLIGICALVAAGKLHLLPQVLLFRADATDLDYFSMVWWSLIVEVHFYVLVPTIYILIKQRLEATCLMAGVLFTLMYILTSFHFFGYGGNQWQNIKLRLVFSLFSQLPAFLVGITLAYIQVTKGQIALSPAMARSFSFLTLLLLSFWLSGKASIPSIGFYWKYPWYVLPESLLWGTLLGLAMMSKTTRFIILDNAILHYLARISYSLYLIHMPILGFIKNQELQATAIQSSIAVVTISIAIAHLMYITVEKPFLNLKKRLTHPQPPVYDA